MIVIGIGHKKRMGKDTAANILAECLAKYHPGWRVRIFHFGDKLKAVAYDLFGWAGVQDAAYYDRMPDARNAIIPALGCTVRDLWVRIGTLAFRNNVHDSTWVDYLFHQLKISDADVAIIPDTRFPNEAERIIRAGGICIKVHRDSVPITNDAADCGLDGWNQWHYELDNFSLEETRAVLDSIVAADGRLR